MSGVFRVGFSTDALAMSKYPSYFMTYDRFISNENRIIKSVV
jgi:hypothetical protein